MNNQVQPNEKTGDGKKIQSEQTDKNNNLIIEEQRPVMNPSQESVAKSERIGIDQQQDAAGNPVINS